MCLKHAKFEKYCCRVLQKTNANFKEVQDVLLKLLFKYNVAFDDFISSLQITLRKLN